MSQITVGTQQSDKTFDHKNDHTGYDTALHQWNCYIAIFLCMFLPAAPYFLGCPHNRQGTLYNINKGYQYEAKSGPEGLLLWKKKLTEKQKFKTVLLSFDLELV